MKISNILHLHLSVDAPNFVKRYKLRYSGKDFYVYSRNFKNAVEDITIFRTSDKCIRLVRTFAIYYMSLDTSSCEYKSFRTIQELADYLRIITP